MTNHAWLAPSGLYIPASKDNVLWSLLYMFLIDWALFEDFVDRCW